MQEDCIKQSYLWIALATKVINKISKRLCPDRTGNNDPGLADHITGGP